MKLKHAIWKISIVFLLARIVLESELFEFRSFQVQILITATQLTKQTSRSATQTQISGNSILKNIYLTLIAHFLYSTELISSSKLCFHIEYQRKVELSDFLILLRLHHLKWHPQQVLFHLQDYFRVLLQFRRYFLILLSYLISRILKYH